MIRKWQSYVTLDWRHTTLLLQLLYIVFVKCFVKLWIKLIRAYYLETNLLNAYFIHDYEWCNFSLLNLTKFCFLLISKKAVSFVRIFPKCWFCMRKKISFLITHNRLRVIIYLNLSTMGSYMYSCDNFLHLTCKIPAKTCKIHLVFLGIKEQSRLCNVLCQFL